MPSKRTLWDHYVEAMQLLARADVHLEWAEHDNEGTRSAELLSSLRADIAAYLKKKAPSQ